MTIEAQLDALIELQTQTNNLLMNGALPKSTLAREAIAENEEKVEKPKTKTKRKSAKQKKVEEDAAKAVEDAEVEDEFGLEEPAAEEVSDEPQMTLDDIEEELRPMVKNGRGKEAKALLAEFGVSRIKEIKAEDINPLYARLKEMNSGE